MDAMRIDLKLDHLLTRHGSSLRCAPWHRVGRRGFSLTELLVVIGIIVLLMGLLFVALRQSHEKARKTQTESNMRQFADACGTFQTEHGFYPGVIPDQVIADNLGTGGIPLISSTENALLHLTGGYRVLSPSDLPGSPAFIDYTNFETQAGSYAIEIHFGTGTNQWSLVVNPNRIGEGPVINGKPYPPYYTPGPKDAVAAQYPHGGILNPTNKIPDLMDGWGQPILYAKLSRDRGPLVQDLSAPGLLPQFVPSGIVVYSQAEQLGELAYPQSTSILNLGAAAQQNETFATILSHPAFFNKDRPLYGTAQGAFVLISAGKDGIFFHALDGPGSVDDPIDAGNINAKIIQQGPRVIDEFDDVVVFGGA